MASNFIGINRGQLDTPQALTVGGSTGSTDIELRIDTGKSTTKTDVIKALRTFEKFILGNGVGTTTGPGVNLPPL